jgi:hypothetical protein
VNFGSAFAGVAAGAVPPPPPPPVSSVVVVVSVEVVSVAVVSVDVDPVEVESGVVVVIVETTVLPPVVTVVTIVVVAWATNGAAPAVKAAVVAPSEIRTANAAPQSAAFLYLRIPPSFLASGEAYPTFRDLVQGFRRSRLEPVCRGKDAS